MLSCDVICERTLTHFTWQFIDRDVTREKDERRWIDEFCKGNRCPEEGSCAGVRGATIERVLPARAVWTYTQTQ